jgi:hypothetical protein
MLFQISENLNMFVRHVSEFEANITSVERIKEYFENKHEVRLINYFNLLSTKKT